MIFMNSKNDVFIIFEGRGGDGRLRSSICYFILQMTAVTKSDPS